MSQTQLDGLANLEDILAGAAIGAAVGGLALLWCLYLITAEIRKLKGK